MAGSSRDNAEHDSAWPVAFEAERTSIASALRVEQPEDR